MHGAQAVQRIESEFLDSLDEDGRRAAEASIDVESDENTCPACGESFAKLPPRCPGCGLRLGA